MKDSRSSHEHFMKEALKEARIAFEKDEIPVGAIIVCHEKIVARAHNLTETLTDVTAHAEMQAITSAANYIGGKYLNECIMYVTLEPCIMCGAASSWSQLGMVVYGAPDKKKGYTSLKENILHPKTKIVAGILENDCRQLILTFFSKKRD